MWVSCELGALTFHARPWGQWPLRPRQSGVCLPLRSSGTPAAAAGACMRLCLGTGDDVVDELKGEAARLERVVLGKDVAHVLPAGFNSFSHDSKHPTREGKTVTINTERRKPLTQHSWYIRPTEHRWNRSIKHCWITVWFIDHLVYYIRFAELRWNSHLADLQLFCHLWNKKKQDCVKGHMQNSNITIAVSSECCNYTVLSTILDHRTIWIIV